MPRHSRRPGRVDPGGLVNEGRSRCGFTVSGLLWLAESVRWGTPALAPSAAVLAAYPLWTWMYAATLRRKLDRAELGNADLAQRPDLYLVRSVEPDCISN